ncbi:MAG: bifunctional diguanylate cyclase/phosphodiesterase [Pseudolabrys sp.]|nr:bifunctional diguanylate cyclase/phosphodiesterase [Pseudolabrys sp.]
MSDGVKDSGLDIARVIVARRAQIRVRVGLCVVIAIVFQTLTGPVPSLIWAAVYVAAQAAEYVTYRRVTPETVLDRRARLTFFAVMVASNMVFASFGIVEAIYAGSWGIVCAGLLWSGAILNGAIVSGESRLALAASIVPPLLHFMIVPYFVMTHGGSAAIAFAIMLAGLLNGVGAIAIWSAGLNLLRTATRASETARLAMLDPETGLPNRSAVETRFASMPQAAEGTVFVAAIQIDRFAHLRGAIGHALTVDLLREVAARFSRVLDDATVSRLSTATLCVDFVAPDANSALRTAALLQAEMTTPIALGDNRVDVSVKIGLSEPGDAVAHINDLSIVDRATIAVDQARTARLSVARFDPALYGSPGTNLSLMSEMTRALDNGQISLHYQPKTDLRSGKIVGVEALIRWQHPQRGAVRPDLFVQMAEETGHIAGMTAWVLRRAVEDQQALARAGIDVAMSVNWSGVVLNDAMLTEWALNCAREAAGPLCLEITETAIIGNPEIARQTLDRFRAAGLCISIDDYGSGLSSLAYLKNIPADELKIDKAFVMNMAKDPVDVLLVRSAVSLAHSLGLKSVAEGVEDQGSLELLAAMGCDLAQGYLIARPMPLHALMDFMNDRQRKAG